MTLLVESRVPAFADVSAFAIVPDVYSIPVFVNILSVPGVLTFPVVPVFSGFAGVAGDCVFLLFFYRNIAYRKRDSENFQKKASICLILDSHKTIVRYRSSLLKF